MSAIMHDFNQGGKVNYLQTWMADRIAEKINIVSVAKHADATLRNKNSLIGSYVAMRTQYGRMHHWPLDETGVDIDVYDHNPHTHYFLALQKGSLGREHVTAGLRLTKVGHFDDALSMAMWSHAVDKPHVVAQIIEHKHDISMLKTAARNGRLWDLTRLVTAMSLQAERTPKTKRATYVALLILMGAAIKFTGENSCWLFTTNREVRRFLDRLGIQYTLLAHGRISYSDTGESYLGWAPTHEAYKQILQNGHPVVAHLAQRGYSTEPRSHLRPDSVS